MYIYQRLPISSYLIISKAQWLKAIKRPREISKETHQTAPTKSEDYKSIRIEKPIGSVDICSSLKGGLGVVST